MPPYSPRIKFAPWAPDLSDQTQATTQNVTNVLPRADGWGPFPSFSQLTQTIPGGVCRGFCFGRNPDASITVFAATPTKIYALNNSTLTWVDVSKAFGTYSALNAKAQWQFEQYNTQIIAVQANAPPQTITLPLTLGASAFADLGGSPPNSAYVSIVNGFIVLSGIASQPYRVQWSDLNNPTQWTAGVGLSDFQDLPDGGITYGIAGFDLFAVVFQSQMARLMTFAPGSPYVFTITKITGGDGNGLLAPYSWVIDQDNVFWLSQEGLKMMTPGGAPQAIGKEMVDRYISSTIDTGNLHLVLFTTEPSAARMYMAYKSIAGQANLFDTVIVYDWVQQRFSRIMVSGQYLDVMSTPGLTLEAMDAATPGAVLISGFGPGASNGLGGNLIRVTVSNTSGMSSAAQQTVYGKWNITQVVGNSNLLTSINNVMNNANSKWGTWAINIVDGSHVDLLSSTWDGASVYTSGGVLGGNIELIPFSFDTVSTASNPIVAAVDANGNMGLFNGPNLQATIETAEYGTQEKRMFNRGFRVITDAPSVFGSVSYRDNPQASYNYTNEVGIDQTGTCLVFGGGIDTRYSRARIRIPAGTSWTYALGIEPDSSLTGSY